MGQSGPGGSDEPNDASDRDGRRDEPPDGEQAAGSAVQDGVDDRPEDEQSGAEQSGAEQSGAEQSGAEQSEESTEGSEEAATALGRAKATAVRRRKLLGGLAVLGGLGIYGFSLFDPPGRAYPQVPQQRLNEGGWTVTEKTRATNTLGSAGPVTLRTTRNSLRYEDQGLARTIRNRPVTIRTPEGEQTSPLKAYAPDAFGDSPSTFTATRVDLSPDVDDLPLGIGLAELRDRVTAAARTGFEAALADAGLDDVTHTGTGTLDLGGGESAPLHEYTATFQVAGFTVSEGGETIQVPASTLRIAGRLAVWPSGDYFVVAGGTYPAENYTQEVTSETDAGGEVTLTFDLGLSPADLEAELLGLMSHTS